jgi:hypothetical protein
MAEKNAHSNRAERNRSLRRRTAAASAGVLLGAFAIVAVTAHQPANQAAASPAATAAIATSSAAPVSNSSSPIVGTGTTSAPGTQPATQSAGSPTAAPSHGTTRQS